MQQPLPTPEEQKRRLEVERKLTCRRHAQSVSASARGLVYPNSGPPDEMLQVWHQVLGTRWREVHTLRRGVAVVILLCRPALLGRRR